MASSIIPLSFILLNLKSVERKSKNHKILNISYIVVIYHLLNQSVTEFDDFLLKYEKLLSHVRQLKSTFSVIYTW